MDQLIAHLRAVAEGRPEALGPLADWCDENGLADKARRLRRRQVRLANKIACLANRLDDAEQDPEWAARVLGPNYVALTRESVENHISNMRSGVQALFRREWREARLTSYIRERTEVLAVADLPKNLRRIYGGQPDGNT
jgi:hypothetical protein